MDEGAEILLPVRVTPLDSDGSELVQRVFLTTEFEGYNVTLPEGQALRWHADKGNYVWESGEDANLSDVDNLTLEPRPEMLQKAGHTVVYTLNASIRDSGKEPLDIRAERSSMCARLRMSRT